jgi:RimJ/RimL family protein N-acetyltransferase
MGDGSVRLVLRAPRLADALTLFAFMGDAEAMRWTHVHASPRELRRYIAGHASQGRRIGFAPWTIIERATGTIIGLGGLYDDPFDPGWGLEVGYFLAPAAWGRGYASELVVHSLAVATAGGAPDLRAFAHPANAASRRVLVKAGFVVERLVPEIDRLLYRRPL